MTRIFHWFFYVKDGSHVKLRHPPRDRTLQYKTCVHFWNNFPCITTLGFTFFWLNSTHTLIYSLCNSVSGDGRVSNWTIVKTALWYNDTLLINFSKTLHNLGEDSITTQLMGQYREGVQGRHEPRKMVSKPLDSPISIKNDLALPPILQIRLD